MRYAVKLSAEELYALAALIGKPLDRVAADGWAAELCSGASVLAVVPEEVPTPDAEHPHGDVECPLVRLGGGPARAESCSVLGEHLGLVRAVNVVSILVGFTPMVDCPAEEIRPGVVLPPSRGYGRTYFPPGQRGQAEREVGAGALVDLDVAFELVCDGCPSLVVYTHGYFIRVSLEGLPAGADWVAFGTYARRPVGAGDRAEPPGAADRGGR
ncbi:hypothetical protein J0H58_11620 [bacterium]|nr:hypothetical protein [bacterium]